MRRARLPGLSGRAQSRTPSRLRGERSATTVPRPSPYWIATARGDDGQGLAPASRLRGATAGKPVAARSACCALRSASTAPSIASSQPASSPSRLSASASRWASTGSRSRKRRPLVAELACARHDALLARVPQRAERRPRRAGIRTVSPRRCTRRARPCAGVPGLNGQQGRLAGARRRAGTNVATSWRSALGMEGTVTPRASMQRPR